MRKRGAFRVAPLLLLGALVWSPPTSAQDASAPRPMLDGAALPVDLVVIRKQARVLELWFQGKPVHAIGGIQLGDAPLGHKQAQGDERTPEGRYTIDWANPQSRYHLSLHISYPDAQDRAFAAGQGRSAGGMIMIHGQPNDWGDDRVEGDWTDGCIALSNAEMDLLWASVPIGTPIEITP